MKIKDYLPKLSEYEVKTTYLSIILALGLVALQSGLLGLVHYTKNNLEENLRKNEIIMEKKDRLLIEESKERREMEKALIKYRLKKRQPEEQGELYIETV